MYNQVIVFGEGLSTLITGIRFLSSVSSVMQNKRRVPFKAFATFSTFVQLLSRVTPPIFIKRRTQGKDVPKVLAFTQFLPSCRFFFTKRGKMVERLNTFRIFVGFLSHLISSKLNNFHGMVEGFPTGVIGSLRYTTFLTTL